MAPRQVDNAVAAKQNRSPLRPSQIPEFLRFPLVVLLSMTLSSLLYSFAPEYASGDLAGVSRTLDQWWEVGALVGWRTFELGLGWYGGYDSYDLVSLTILSHGPPLYLLSAFYEIRRSTVLLSLAIDCLITYIPFRLLRPLSTAHSASSSSSLPTVQNKDILTDPSIQTITTLLAASIYSVVLYAALGSRLPVYLVMHFENIPSVAAAHDASPLTLLPVTILFGLAAKSFIFTPTIAAASFLPGAEFDPVTATLFETLKYNLWGYSPKVKVVIQRTATLMLVSGVNTAVQTAVTVEGVEVAGALVYSAVWVVAAGVTGAVLGLVGVV